MTAKILVETAGPVTTLIINRPQARNALDNEAARALGAAFKAFEADRGAQASERGAGGQRRGGGRGARFGPARGKGGGRTGGGRGGGGGGGDGAFPADRHAIGPPVGL